LTAVIFDLDGTLVDSQRAITASLRYVLRQCGREKADDDGLRWALGPPLQTVMRRLLNTTDPAEITRAVVLYRAHHPTVFFTHAMLYPGIPDVLDGLTEAGCRLFVATSKLRTVADHVLTYFGVRRPFESVSGSELDGQFSTKAAVIGHVVRTYRLNPHDTVMVGDRADDILGARAHDIRSVAVAYGYGDRAELEAAGPDEICDHPEQLPAMLIRVHR